MDMLITVGGMLASYGLMRAIVMVFLYVERINRERDIYYPVD